MFRISTLNLDQYPSVLELQKDIAHFESLGRKIVKSMSTLIRRDMRKQSTPVPRRWGLYVPSQRAYSDVGTAAPNVILLADHGV